MTEIQKVSSVINEVLGRPYFGSKSVYRETHPDSDPIFNAYILWQDSNGYLNPVHHCDLEYDKHKDLLFKTTAKLKENGLVPYLYVYRESTVHNETFNGRCFPYNDWVFRILYQESDFQ